MINIVATILIIYSIGQIALGIAVLTGKFEPLLPTERKKLPAKIRKKARRLNGISMLATSVILGLLSIGMLTSIDALIYISAVAMVVFIIAMSTISLKTENKYFK